MSLSANVVMRTMEIVFALLAMFFLSVAIGAVVADDLGALPARLGLPIGIGGAVVIFAVAILAPRKSSAIAFDEGYQAEWLRAQAVGYWGYVVAFAIGGNLVAAGLLPAGRVLLAGSMGAAAVPFVVFLARRWFGRA